MDLPTLDFSLFLQGNDREKRALSERLVDSFKKHGFVKLKNHGLPEATVKQFLSATKQVFDLPIEQKQKFQNIKGPHPQRGWSCKGDEVTAKLWKENIKEGTNGNDLKDEREFFDAGPPDDMEYSNKWPADSLSSFRAVMEECYSLLQQASLQIIDAMEIGLHMPAGTLRERCAPSASEIRLNHYPAVDMQTLRKGIIKRTWPHTDFGIITLLFQDDIGGLELEDRTAPGKFVPVDPGPAEKPSEMVVNISDTLERWSNGVIRAGVHRVDVPRGMKGQKLGTCPDRYSSIFFFKAARETSVGPLPAFISEKWPAQFGSITALEFQKQRTGMLYENKY